jgi:hypothetical protein
MIDIVRNDDSTAEKEFGERTPSLAGIQTFLMRQRGGI